MTLTNYLIICGLGQEIVRVEGLDTMLSELKAQGRNLNQFTALANMGQVSVVRGVLDYAEKDEKTRWGDTWLVTGSNCVPQSAFIELRMTKEHFHKTGGTQFYHFVQFSPLNRSD